MDTWRTAIVDAGPDHIRVRGHDVLELMRQSTFTDLIFLLHHDRLPTAAERRLVDAILIGGAEHGGAGSGCMELIAAGLERVRTGGVSIETAAGQLVDEARSTGVRLPGFGHRVHVAIDPRVEVLFTMAAESQLAGDGIRFARA